MSTSPVPATSAAATPAATTPAPTALAPGVTAPSASTVAAAAANLPSEASLIRPTIGATNLSTPTLFGVTSVHQLRDTDFALNSKERITLNYSNCVLVLFYNDNQESKYLAKLWAEAAAQVAGPSFAAVNINLERKVAEAFTQLNAEPDNPNYAFRLRSLPFILVYRGGWPKAFYNGGRSVQLFVDYAMTLACNSGYKEPVQTAGAVQAENNFEMTMYGDFKQPISSTDFKVASQNLRGYDSRIPPVIQGSAEEAKEIVAVQQLREAQAAGATTQAAAPRVAATAAPAPAVGAAPAPVAGTTGIPIAPSRAS